LVSHQRPTQPTGDRAGNPLDHPNIRLAQHIHRSPQTVHRLTVHRLTVHRSPLTVHHKPFTVHRSPFTA